MSTAGLPHTPNAELVDLLALTTGDLPAELWVEISMRLGVEGPAGIRAAAVPAVTTGADAERLRRFQALWAGQPEARGDRYEALKDEARARYGREPS